MIVPTVALCKRTHAPLLTHTNHPSVTAIVFQMSESEQRMWQSTIELMLLRQEETVFGVHKIGKGSFLPE